MGNTCIDLYAPADLESTNPCTESFQPFIPELSVPEMEVECLSESKRGKRDDEKRRGLHYFAASIVVLEVQKTTYFLISLFFCRLVNLKLSLY